MLIELSAPSRVADFRRVAGRVDDVGEEHGRQDALGRDRRVMPFAGHELFDIGADAPVIAGRHPVIAAGIFDVFGPGDPLGEVARSFDGHHRVGLAMQDQGGHADLGQDMAHIELQVHFDQGAEIARAASEALDPRGGNGAAHPGRRGRQEDATSRV